jgi:predicted dehydrogenase
MTQKQSSFSRRRFLKTAAAVGAASAAPTFLPGKVLGKDGRVAPSERITLGAIGIGGRGHRDLGCFFSEPDVQFIAICDVRKSRRDAIKEMADQHYGNQDCAQYRDMHEMLARDDLDAVLIATGDRWHTLAAIIAAKAGKDIYSEKPCSLTIEESRALADTINRYGSVYQAGTQRRNIGNFLLATHLVQSGRLGKIHTLHANTLHPGTSRDWRPAQPQPPKEEVDWDRWLGPVPWRPYHEAYVRGGWRGFFDLHGGGILEWGSHTVDQCQWANGSDDTTPVEYVPEGNNVHATYADGTKLVMRDSGWLGLGTCSVRYEGEEGWVETGDSGRMAIYPDALRSEIRDFTQAGTDPTWHIREFLDCVKTRGVTSANASVCGQSHIVCHAAYIAWQLGRPLKFDPVKEEFLGDEEANRLRKREKREPWRI